LLKRKKRSREERRKKRRGVFPSISNIKKRMEEKGKEKGEVLSFLETAIDQMVTGRERVQFVFYLWDGVKKKKRKREKEVPLSATL